MGRPGVFGKQLVTNGGNFIGINIGYNYFCEHEGGTEELCDFMNELRKYRGISGSLKLKRIAKEPLRYKDTPFGNYMLLPVVTYFRCAVLINNDDLKYRTRLMHNGVWDMLYLGTSGSIRYFFHKLYEHRQKINGELFPMTEADLFYMEDYNNLSSVNFGFARAGQPGVPSGSGIVGCWGSSDDYLYLGVSRDLVDCDVMSQLIVALKAGHLAICPEERRLFADRGCCLVDVAAVYGR